MKLKLDENGNVVLQNGMPVWVDGDGKEIAYDVPKLVNDLRTANGESAGRRKELESLTAKMAAFEGLDPEKAKAALETVANLDAGSLVTAGKVEELKAQIAKSWESKLVDVEKTLKENLSQAEAKLADKNANIRKLLIRGVFDQSKFLSEKTLLPPDLAFDSFGKHFDVEETESGFKVVAKVNGEPIFSRVNPGNHATPEEALETIIESYQFKDRILRAPDGGSGTHPGAGVGGGRTMARAAFDALPPAQKAQTVKDGIQIV